MGKHRQGRLLSPTAWEFVFSVHHDKTPSVTLSYPRFLTLSASTLLGQFPTLGSWALRIHDGPGLLISGVGTQGCFRGTVAGWVGGPGPHQQRVAFRGRRTGANGEPETMSMALTTWLLTAAARPGSAAQANLSDSAGVFRAAGTAEGCSQGTDRVGGTAGGSRVRRGGAGL